MNKIDKKQLDSFIEKEALKILYEEDTFEETIEAETEEEIKNLKNIIDVKRTALGRARDENMRVEINAELKRYKERLDKAEERLKITQNTIEDKKRQERETEEKKSKEGVTADIEMELTEQKHITTPFISKKFKEKALKKRQLIPAKKSTTTTKAEPSIKSKNVWVKFDRNTPNEFFVNFTKRGFVIADTRLSFELLEKALSKKFTITLKNGFVLDSLKMQKILNYKKRL